MGAAEHQPRHYRPGADLIAAQHIVDALAGTQKSTLAGWVHGQVGGWVGGWVIGHLSEPPQADSMAVCRSRVSRAEGLTFGWDGPQLQSQQPQGRNLLHQWGPYIIQTHHTLQTS